MTVKTYGQMGRAERIRYVNQALTSFPETPPIKIEEKMASRSKRRAKNKVAKRSRRGNRH